MKKILLPLLLFAFCIALTNKTQAQTIELMGGNTLNGAMNGVVLGGATMALQNSDDFRPVEVGLGAGILYGLGVGIYDVSRVDAGQQFYISGTFNDGTNTSILVLLDTFYGAAAGALVASSVALITQGSFVEALQYGSGAGAWAGFGFGLIDAFMLAEGPNFSQSAGLGTGTEVSGLMTYSNASRSLEVGMISPSLFKQKKIGSRALTTAYAPSVKLVQLHLNL